MTMPLILEMGFSLEGRPLEAWGVSLLLHLAVEFVAVGWGTLGRLPSSALRDGSLSGGSSSYSKDSVVPMAGLQP